MTIVVVGAGIGGLAVAAALARRGVNCVVLERSPSFSDGAGIQIAPNGAAVLQRLGVVLRPAARPVERQIRRWRDDSLIASVDLGEAYYTLRRSVLHRQLLAGVDVRPGVGCTGVNDRGDHVVVSLGDGTRMTADAVIGADGLRSVVRRAVVSDRLRPSGFTAYRAVVPATLDRVVVRLGPGSHLVSYPLGDGSMNVVAVVPTDVPLLEAFDGWHPAARDLLVGPFQRHELFDRPRAAWRRGRILLVGDAAHPMLPFVAQGACQALEDAEALAADLGGYPGARPARVARVAAAGLAAARDYHLPDGPSQRVRDLNQWARVPPAPPGTRSPASERSAAGGS
ncbi:FAD-dependent monooxygenase [Actinoplanes sp. LDG1-06]|uniref:FAD-dependent monooxygenase n=1 Tax=Paractinoplanes ovalisporus TaxID=2810368 RepID=A0ABS2A8D7_9ACTN|nr:FAD-dependent monooxygenase [Actinoplanes ovalisporus]MBM2616010.1 FAD-dependent monooxygenase [Actinoplanes ovalisporus]